MNWFNVAKTLRLAAGRKPTKEDAEVTLIDCKNPECDFVFEGKVKNFCPMCRTNQL